MLSYDSLTIISSFVEDDCLNNMANVSREYNTAIDEEIRTNGPIRKTLRWRELIYNIYKNGNKTKSVFATSCSIIRSIKPVIDNLDEYLKYCHYIPYTQEQEFILNLFETCCYKKLNDPTPDNPRKASNTIAMMVMIRIWRNGVKSLVV